MRPVLACALLSCAVGLAAELPVSERRAPVSLVMKFAAPYSAESFDAMKQELNSVVREAGLTFDYKLRDQLSPNETLFRIIMVKFRGHCTMSGPAIRVDEGRPYAFAHVSDGKVLSFAEVECDRVRQAIRSRMNGEHLKRRDAILGRALARVLAHEVYHILARTKHHGSRGIAKSCLSRDELIADVLPLDSPQVEQLREAGL